MKTFRHYNNNHVLYYILEINIHYILININFNNFSQEKSLKVVFYLSGATIVCSPTKRLQLEYRDLATLRSF